MRILLLDNYDSFTFNLYHYLLENGADCTVWRNDASEWAGFDPSDWEGIVLSPGPGRPENAGIMPELLEKYLHAMPVLGVCLGHQAIGAVYGVAVVRAAEPVHGKTSVIRHSGGPLFRHIPEQFRVMRYHSLVLEDLSNTPLQPTAYTASGEIMALCHRNLPVFGVQFHPESILTDYGSMLVGNWLEVVKNYREGAGAFPVRERHTT